MVGVIRNGHGNPERPSPARIAGYSGAFVVHLLAFGLLLMPIVAPLDVVVQPTPKPRMQVVEVKRIEPEIKPLPPVPVPPVPVRRTPRPATTPVVPQPTPILTDTRIPEPAIPVIEAPEMTPYVPPLATGPIDAGELATTFAPPPTYPAVLARRGIEGEVVLRILVGANGKAREVQIQRSSGQRQFDDAARRQALRTWRFRPALQDGVPVQAWGVITVNFRMTEA